VVFTDDDVNPAPTWLSAIADISRRWPDYSVFGGRIYVDFPSTGAPAWANSPYVQKVAYALHEYADREVPYVPGRAYPCGANLWIRRSLLADGRRFDSSIGPRPKKRIMGSETSFMRQLVDEGHGILHAPGAVVGHCIQPEMLTPRYVRRRAYRRGRSAPHGTNSLVHEELRKRSKLLWWLTRGVSIARWVIKYGFAFVMPSGRRRLESSSRALIGLALDVESVKLAASGGEDFQRHRSMPDDSVAEHGTRD
jgi:hypothetical protein